MQIGVDIGGTFTDIVALGEEGRLAATKVPTTPKDLLLGVAEAVRRVLALAGAHPAMVRRFIHGTTVATNAVLEQKGTVTGVLMTAGFEDVLALGRQKRSRMYDLDMDAETPTFLAPRRRRVGIRERLDARGRVLVPLDEAQVRTEVARLRDQGVQALAVCYLFSFLNPAHERRTRELCREVAPELAVSLSSEVDPTFREYERLCVTAFDAYLGPLVARYLAGLAETLQGLGVRAVPQIMRSRGGIVSAAVAARQPVTLFLSGPAGGVVGARFAAERSGVRDFISLDMGGTSNDVSVVRDGRPVVAPEGRIGPYPVRTPMVDVNTIGAGGGSIAWLDGAGGLRVGPQSAGAEPGPACYGRGGDRPTVTDASLLLGYLNPANFAGGALRLDPPAAESALAGIARRLGLDPVATAAGIHRVVNARMADQIRLMTIQRGHDPREFTLVLLGGAGPVHGVALAEELGLRDVLVPEAPGVLSAFGLLAAAVEHQHARTLPGVLEQADLVAVNACLRELDAAGRARMREEDVPPEAVEVVYVAEMRYAGQAYELPVPIAAPLGSADLAAVRDAFHAVHERVYGYARAGQAVEFVNFRAVHTYPLPRPRLTAAARAVGAVADARTAERRAYFPPAGFVATPVYARARLPLGARLPGPTILEQPDTTTVLPPGWTAEVEGSGSLRLRRG
ncbi:MAG TPA: hydantoinase/oxoprolinase family protein [Methylomirabilota bacterium]|jgi:N-methylhydantoinase A/oxoprolinase/acetone carboxylase beta subunit|nr:hydantoinase/oxoprolinase family protein [Methylomirabilota bacterium]